MRVALFLDGKNFFKTFCNAHPNTEISYDNLAREVVYQLGGDRAQFMGAYYYTGHYSGRSTFTKFLSGLNLREGFFVRREPWLKRTHKCKSCGKTHSYRTEKRVDTRLVADMIHYAAMDAYDVAVLFSGDQDLVPAVEAVNRLGKKIYVATWQRKGLSKELRGRCFGEIDLSSLLDKISTGRRSGQVASVQPLATETITEQTAEAAQETVIEETVAPETVRALPVRIETILEEGAYDFIGEIRRAAAKLPYLSRWYFENSWNPTAKLPAPGDGRAQGVQKLIDEGIVEVYPYTDVKGRSSEGIRIKPEAPPVLSN